MSQEDLRDLYKNSRQHNDVKLKLNGATYRRVDSELKMKHMGNIVTRVRQHANQSEFNDNNKELNNINFKYELSFQNLPFSLNKKQRWRLKDDLKPYKDENANDVQLYETSNRIWNTKNLVTFERKKMYNKDLAVRCMQENTIQKITSTKKHNTNECDEGNSLTQYRIEYAPKKEVLKYGYKRCTYQLYAKEKKKTFERYDYDHMLDEYFD